MTMNKNAECVLRRAAGSPGDWEGDLGKTSR